MADIKELVAKKCILVIFGPTASGKTDLSIKLAKKLGSQIISCDSQQVYHELFIGTARPTKEEMKGVKHYLIGHVSVTEEYNVARYIEDFAAVADTIFSLGKLPIVAGGTNMWLSSLLDGLSPAPPKDDAVRKNLEDFVSKNGPQKLHSQLIAIDQESALKIKPTDTKRIVRAMEMYLVSGKTRTELFKEKVFLPYTFIPVAITRPIEEIYDRINARVDKMVEAGLLDEVKGLVEKGLEDDVRRIKAHGYPALLDWAHGVVTLEEALETMRMDTRHYAKRQMTFIRSRSDFTVFENAEKEMILQLLEDYDG
ncbi:MAG: tRNA (adenosine(37)-N6)-dimethylallyltransferase MiaA [Caldisericia bacterium]|nr:tRNA (adenosine(37)-N6)-dimethylallyltransferase MiaA [Caldisericia bacterium]